MALQSEFNKRLQDEGYKRWLISGHGLLIIKQAVSPFVEVKLKTFHQNLLKNYSNATCQKCDSKAIEYKNKKWNFKNPCPHNVCDRWLDSIVKEHRQGNQPQNVYWKNTQVKLWPKMFWEVAKVYMDRGQKADNTSPELSDVSGILALFTNCLLFNKDLTSISLVTDVKGSRNKTMHSANMSLTKEDLTAILKTFFKLLEDPKEMLQIDSCKTAVQELKKLQNEDFSLGVLHETEIKLLKERMLVLEESFSDVKDDQETQAQKIEEISSTLRKIFVNKDLYESLQQQVEVMVEGHQEVKDALHDLENKINSDRSHTTEELKDLRQRIELLEDTPTPGCDVVDYKGKLQHHCQLQPDCPLPVYTSLTQSSGFKSEVSVFDQKFTSPGKHRRLRDAHQAAALLALQELRLMDSSQSVEECQGTVEEEHEMSDSTLKADIQPRNELDAVLLEQLHQPKAAYKMTRRRSGSRDTEYSVSVTCRLPNTVQVLSMASKKAAAEQEAAETVLTKCGLKDESGSSSKNVLYSHCGRKHRTVPLYDVQQKKNSFSVVIWADCIPEPGAVTRDGGYYESEVSAIENGASKFIALLKELKLIDASTKPEVNTGDSSLKPSHTEPVKSAQASPEAADKTQPAQGPLITNPKGTLLEYFQKRKLPKPDISIQQANGNFKGRIKLTTTFKLPLKEYTVKKVDAEKKVAQYACRKVLKENVDVDKAKNKLQEYCQKRQLQVPHYETETKDGKNGATVKVELSVDDEKTYKKQKEAERSVCSICLSIVSDEE